MRSSGQLASSSVEGAAVQLEFEFTVEFELAEHDVVLEAVMQRLESAGCADALVGAGASCTVELQFITRAATAQEALDSAAEAVQRAFPGAQVVRILPAPDTPTASTTATKSAKD